MKKIQILAANTTKFELFWCTFSQHVSEQSGVVWAGGKKVMLHFSSEHIQDK